MRSGSSPRSRGARGHDLCEVVDHGIIPAFAGSTLLAKIRFQNAGDHPRVRGEHTAFIPTSTSM